MRNFIFLFCLFIVAPAQAQEGIDIIIGAKGDPQQLVDSTLHFTAEPYGVISGATVAIVSRHPQVKNIIPLALDDKYKDFRIVGTSAAWLDIYKASLAEGRLWEKPFEAVAGAETGLKIGDHFTSVHNDGKKHKNTYTVTGKLAKSDGPADHLILTGIPSIYETHNVRDVPDHSHHDDKPHSHGADAINHEATALLIQSTAPYDKVNIPREINRTKHLQAVNPLAPKKTMELKEPL